MLTVCCCVLTLFGCQHQNVITKTEDYARWVNLFIGTGGHGHTFPGPVVPHGMIQPGPDTRIDGWDACAGYHYADSTVNGFSHTHLSGTGRADYGDVLIMPTVGEQMYEEQELNSQQLPYASSFHIKMRRLFLVIIPFGLIVIMSRRNCRLLHGQPYIGILFLLMHILGLSWIWIIPYNGRKILTWH